MEGHKIIFFAVIFYFSTNSFLVLSQKVLNTYIIRVQPQEDRHTANANDLESYYRSFLPGTIAESSEESHRMVHSYSEVFSGFCARLTEDELAELKKKDGFMRAYPNRRVTLHTTHNPDFVGLRVGGGGAWDISHMGEGVIIGIIDDGILANHPSFYDDGMQPPPAKWKGTCSLKTGHCNNKLIGAQSVVTNSSRKVYSVMGHGMHVSGIAAGNFVPGANLFGLANGTAAGIAPRAHLAMYQVCNETRFIDNADVLAGMDAAVKDGVDVLSISMGYQSTPFEEDPLAIGAFGALEKGVFVVGAAGNEGSYSISNQAPWLLTVGASITDRSLRATLTLGNGQKISGETLWHVPTHNVSKLSPLYYPKNFDCAANLTADRLKGKFVLCKYSQKSGLLVKQAGAVGMILINDKAEEYNILANRISFLPTLRVSHEDAFKIVSYINSAGRRKAEPTASMVLAGTVLGTSLAPVVAPFSSRGPSILSPGILKPDITAPGVNILSAWPQNIPLLPKEMYPDLPDYRSNFNLQSGTSMSTPLLGGVAALVKAVHPNWSVAAVKSAIMTTSDVEYPNGKPIIDDLHKPASFFSLGAGHVNASRVVQPGLVYDLGVDDYIAYICGLLGESKMSIIVPRRNVSCSEIGSISEVELNYPSILVPLDSEKVVTVKRTVTNVGEANSIYTALVDVPKEMITVNVEPKTLKFVSLNEKKSFTVSVRCNSSGGCREGAQGNLRWVSKNHIVRSPIVIPPTST